MNIISPQNLLKHQEWRYAVKKFDASRKIDDATWDALEQSLILSPSSFGLQPWKFLIITDQPLRERLKPASWNQSQVTDCSHYVVFCAKKSVSEADVDHLVHSIAVTRGVEVQSLKGYRDVMVGFAAKAEKEGWAQHWTTRQTYIALGNLMTSAAMLGIDTCPMEGFEPEKYDEILGLPARGLNAVVACCVGYRSPDDKYAKARKVRFPAHELVERI